MTIICSGNDDIAYCEKDGTRLIERKDGTAICSTCEKTYNLETGIAKHLMDLQPEINKQYSSNAEPDFIRLDKYAEAGSKKKQEVTAYEDVYWAARKSGLHITDSEEFLPG
jgi:uncharacterized Zn finger protein (UPF0148 family)